MTGEQFKAHLKAAGYNQTAFAEAMQVHRDTIGRQCQAENVEAYWGYALIGLMAAKNTGTIADIVHALK